MRALRRLSLALFVALTGVSTQVFALSVAAAASLADVMPELVKAWEAQGGERVRVSYEGSSRLAAQLQAGAPFDVFIGADEAWMKRLVASKLVDAGSVRAVASNTLVCVVPAKAVSAPSSVEALADVKRLALAAENVPAGRYAREALSKLGVWARVSPQVVNASNVRRALFLVSMGEVDAGLVYATDARAEPDVRVAFELPAHAHPRIVYPAGVVASSSSEQARAFVDFLVSEPARRLWSNAGFLSP